jgi:arylsulfatase A-like enzyme
LKNIQNFVRINTFTPVKQSIMKKLTRRTFLKTVGLTTAAISIPGCSRFLTTVESRSSRQPNILFIVIDDVGDQITCLGGKPEAKTPNIDSIAKRGILFTNAHCSVPDCNFSRVSVLTGIGPAAFGVLDSSQNWRQSPVLKDAVTIPEHFRANGYRVIGGGKIFNCLTWTRTGEGTDQNDFSIWDQYFPSKTKSIPDSVWPAGTKIDPNDTAIWQPQANGDKEQRPPYYFDWAPMDYPDDQMADYKVVSWAISELKKNHKNPFFLAAGISAPHIPWFVPKEYFDMYSLDQIQLPIIKENDLDDCPPAAKSYCRREWHKWIVENNLWKNALQAYLAGITFADAQVGRLIDALDKSRYAENTIIVLCSDHGLHLGQKEHWQGSTLWEESTHLPLVVVAPGVSKPFSRCSRPVSLLDIYPTLIELCSHKGRAQLKGESLIPLLRDPQAGRGKPAVTTFGTDHSVRTERWRYTKYHDGTEELYDHQIDPGEFTNLADQPEYDHIKLKLSAWIPENK